MQATACIGVALTPAARGLQARESPDTGLATSSRSALS